jgi:DNA sulfur modification protein DndD
MASIAKQIRLTLGAGAKATCPTLALEQNLAVSVLWGLARASAHPLPAIIDTPMARLDAAHRRHLVERYFPHASHQVLILSTDTEVDRHYYQALQPHIARAYHLDYDETTRATQGQEGYFWEETPQAGESGSAGT